MRVIYRKIRHARYLYIKRNVEKVWGARYTLGALSIEKYGTFGEPYGSSPCSQKHNLIPHSERVPCSNAYFPKSSTLILSMKLRLSLPSV